MQRDKTSKGAISLNINHIFIQLKRHATGLRRTLSPPVAQIIEAFRRDTPSLVHQGDETGRIDRVQNEAGLAPLARMRCASIGQRTDSFRFCSNGRNTTRNRWLGR
jgi:hypothetical protein